MAFLRSKHLVVTLILGCMLFLCKTVQASLQATASHILVKDKAKRDQIRKLIEESDDMVAEFSNQAKLNSDCPSGKSGGDLGSFGRGMMVPEFDKVVFEKDIMKIHDADTQFGFHLVLTTSRTGGGDSEL